MNQGMPAGSGLPTVRSNNGSNINNTSTLSMTTNGNGTHEEHDEEDDLDLSDVPEGEHEGVIDDEDDNDDNDDDDDNDSEDHFSDIIREDDRYIHEKIFKNVSRLVVKINEDDGIPEEPEEELDDEERLRLLRDHLDPQQMSRYEYYRRTTVNKGGVKKIANSVLNQSVSNSVAVVLSGVSKVFLGEIIERAKLVKKRYDKANLLIKLNEKRELKKELRRQMDLLKKEENFPNSFNIAPLKSNIEKIKFEIRRLNLRNVNEKGPLLPEHIREAWRLYKLESGTAPNAQWRAQGERDGLMFR